MKLQYTKVATMCAAGHTARQVSEALAVEVYQLYNWRSQLPVEQRNKIKFGKSTVKRGPRLGSKRSNTVSTSQIDTRSTLTLPIGLKQQLLQPAFPM